MATECLTQTVQTVANGHNGRNHHDRQMGIVGQLKKPSPRPKFPDTLLAREVNVVWTMKLSKVILDKDSPHGTKEAADWATLALKSKLKRLNLRYEKTMGPKGEETRASSAIKRQIGFLESVQAIVQGHVEQLKAGQAGFKARFDGVVAKWDHKKKIPDFVDSVIAKYCVPGVALATPVALKVSRLWDSVRGALDSVISQKNKWIMDVADVAAYVLGTAADFCGAYFGRKWLINWAANRKGEMDVKKQLEFGRVEKERQAMLRTEYDEVQREIVALLWPASHLN